MEISNLPDAEFKTQITRLLNKFRGKVDDLRENFNNEKGNIKLEIEKKKNHSEMKNTLREIKTIFLKINNRLDEAED